MRIPGYDQFSLIATGGFAHVYRAHQSAFDRDVAVKVLTISLDHERDRRRFDRECAAMGRLTGHPHIVTVLESGFTPDGQPFFTTPYYSGGSVGEHLSRRGPFTVAQTLQTGIALAGALETANRRGILHRDVKPENVLLSSFGEPALADFGIAAVIGADGGAASQITNAFTVAHAPPEILEGRPASVESDVYSLGSTLWMMLSGVSPFGRDDGQGLIARVLRVQSEPVPPLGRDDVPASLEDALRAALAKQIHDRPRSARAFGATLQAIQAELGEPVTPLRAAVDGFTTATGVDAATQPLSVLDLDADLDRGAPAAIVSSGARSQPTGPPPAGPLPWSHPGAVRWAGDPPPPEPPAPEPAPPLQPVATARPLTRSSPRPPPLAPKRRRRPGLVLASVAAAIIVALLVVAAIVLRSGDSSSVATGPSTTATPVPTTAAAAPAPTTSTSSTTTSSSSSTTTTAAPTTTAPPTTTPSAPASAIVPAGTSATVRDATGVAQKAANALAVGDWDAARKLVPSLAGASDADLADAWGSLDQSTIVLTDAQASAATKGRPKSDKATGVVLRLGQVAHEHTADVPRRTSLYCVTWTVTGGQVVAMADQQVIGAPWKPDTWADPAQAAPVLRDACHPL